MLKVVGVRFKTAGKISYFDPCNLFLKENDNVIVETIRGIEYGRVVLGIKYFKEDEVALPLKKILRIATKEDSKINENNKKEASKALQICKQKVLNHNLKMKLIDAEFTFDKSKLIFYFTAEGRIDFRQLVKDLAAIFKIRIELRQIGVRDEAKMLGGIGPCGRILCCSSFLGDFEPVSIKMAKDQNLSLNPIKISGLCGRLMCCLKYENENYEAKKEAIADIGQYIKTPMGKGKVVSLDFLEQKIKVELVENLEVVELNFEELTKNSLLEKI